MGHRKTSIKDAVFLPQATIVLVCSVYIYNLAECLFYLRIMQY